MRDIIYSDKFKMVENEGDGATWERTFSGRLTKMRYKFLSRWARVHSQVVENCGCIHDCCGHVCNQHATFKYSKNQVVLTYSQSINV